MKVPVIASGPISADSLRASLGGATSSDAEIMVVAPALHRSALRFRLSDANEAIGRAVSEQRYDDGIDVDALQQQFGLPVQQAE